VRSTTAVMPVFGGAHEETLVLHGPERAIAKCW
jgi:hypothetical protein